jgi:hypothetical protein
VLLERATFNPLQLYTPVPEMALSRMLPMVATKLPGVVPESLKR